MSEWRTGPLGSFVEFQRGIDITRAHQNAGDVPVVSSGGVSSYHSEAYSPGPGVVIGRKGTLGKAFYLPGPYWPHDTTLWVRDFKGSHPKFVYYFMSKFDVSWLDAGSANPTLNRNHLHPVVVTWPSPPEQRAIAEVLGALDDKIAANTTLATTADLYASSVLIGSLSADRVRLDSIARITMGSSPKGETLNELGEGVPFYQGVRDYGFRSPTRRVFTTAPVRSADAGDILVSVRAPVGEVNVANEPLCIGRGIAAVRSTIGTQATLFHQLKAERDAWEPYEAEGTVFGSINRDQLHGIQLRPVAPERAAAVEQELASLESSIAATLTENSTLAATRDALLPQLMSGKLRVRDAEAAASEAGV